MERAIELLRRLNKEKFYGKITFTIKEGEAVHAEENRSHKLTEK